MLGRFWYELALELAAYWGVDRLLRGRLASRLLERLGLSSRAIALIWLALGAGLAPLWGWSRVVNAPLLSPCAVGLVALLAWPAITRDWDPVTGKPERLERLALLLAVVGSGWSPGLWFSAALLLAFPFDSWEHHSAFPMRLVQALGGHLLLALLPWHRLPEPFSTLFSDASSLVFLLLVIQISHYWITALAKAWLGPRWYSWVTENRLHYLAASAYSWGWARFWPWQQWRKVVLAVQRYERPFQVFAFTLELGAPLALLSRASAVGFGLGWAAFHVGVFLVSGLLFWEWILVDLLLSVLVLRLPEAVAHGALGGGRLLAGLAVMGLFPLRHKLWKPMPLGWFDTPFTQRIHWLAVGRSGQRYGVYNNLMSPHERLYGKVHGCFLVPLPVLTYQLGEVWKPALRDAIVAAGPNLERLAPVREQFGIRPHSAALTAHHVAYLSRFFYELNRGAPKSVLPRSLAWLKAPGGQIYHWGDLPAFSGQEAVARVELWYREEYFDGTELVRLVEEQVLEIPIDSAPPPIPAPELTPKQMDDFLLGFAVGRLIDLPASAGGFVRSDDGHAK
jgi:hypothetical protein